MDEVKVPKPEETRAARLQFVRESTYSQLMFVAKNMGFNVQQAMPGLTNLPDQQLAHRFREACDEIVKSLEAK